MNAPSQALPSANDLLTGGGRRYRSLSFKGDRAPVEYRDLTVLAEPETFQDRNDEQELLFWDASTKGKKTTERTTRDGEPNTPIPVYSVKVRLPEGATPSSRIVEEYGEDNRERYFYFGGSMERGSGSQFDAVATAIRRGRAKRGLQPGGTLRRIAWVAGGEDTGGTKSTPKIYEVEYDPSTEWPASGSPNGQLTRAAGRRDEVPPPAGPTDGGAYEDDEPPF